MVHSCMLPSYLSIVSGYFGSGVATVPVSKVGCQSNIGCIQYMVKRINLVGYLFRNRKHPGVQNAHEMLNDDYLVLAAAHQGDRSSEGQVISNSRLVDGAFAVLQVGGNAEALTGAVEVSRYDPCGLVGNTITNRNTLRDICWI